MRRTPPVTHRAHCEQFESKKLARSPSPKTAAKPTARKRTSKVKRSTIGGIIEPDWSRLLTAAAERKAASEHWCRIAGEMDELQILSPSNGHALQRLVLAYLHYDRCSLEVGSGGLVTAKNPDNPKSIERLSVHYQAMREAEKTTERLEKQLGLTPGNRAKVGKVARKRERSTGADAFLGAKE